MNIKMNKRKIVTQIVESVVNKLLIKEGEEKPATTFENAQELLDQGYEPEEVFDEVEYFYCYCDRVVLNGKENFISQDLKIKILSDQWFDAVYEFNHGVGMVKLNGKYNFIDEDGYFICDWLEDAEDFDREGFAQVKLHGEWRVIDTSGRFADEYIDDREENSYRGSRRFIDLW